MVELNTDVLKGDDTYSYYHDCFSDIIIDNPVKSDREAVNQRPDGYTSFMEGLYEGLMDDKGNIIISPKRGYRSIGDFIGGVAIGFRLDHKPKEGGWGLLNERARK